VSWFPSTHIGSNGEWYDAWLIPFLQNLVKLAICTSLGRVAVQFVLEFKHFLCTGVLYYAFTASCFFLIFLFCHVVWQSWANYMAEYGNVRGGGRGALICVRSRNFIEKSNWKGTYGSGINNFGSKTLVLGLNKLFQHLQGSRRLYVLCWISTSLMATRWREGISMVTGKHVLIKIELSCN